MNRTERFYRIDQLLHERRVVSLQTFLDTLAISRATFKRDMEYLRDRLNAPIVWDRGAGGYRFATDKAVGPSYELPDGGYRLTVPYADERELSMDILRHGAQVVVEAPAALRQCVAAAAERIAALYR